MAKVAVEIIGDSASLTAALGSATAGLVRFGAESEVTGAKVDATFAGMSDSALRLAVAQDKLAISTARYGAGSTGAAAAASLYRKQVEGIAESNLAAAATVGRTITTHVTAPAALLGYEAVKMGANFQAAMLQIQTQAGASADEVKNLSGQVLNLASSGAQQGPVELAKGLFHLESVGLRGSQAMQVLREASMAAAVGMAPLEDVATALGGAVVTGISGTENYAKAMGTLNAIVGAGNMHMGDLVGALGTGVLPAAKNAGLSLDQVGAALAVMTDRGIGADQAATRLRMTFALMQSPSDKAKESLKDLGISGNEMAVMLRQPNGLMHVLQLLHDGMGRVGAVRGSQDILGAFGGGRSGAGILTLVQSLDSATSSYQEKLKQIQETGSQLAASEAAQQQTTAAKFHAATAAAEADLVKLGGAITPTVTFVLEGIDKIAGAFGHLPAPIKRDIGVVVGILAVGGPLILAVVGVTRAVRSIGTAFEFMSVTAGPAIATVDAEVASIGVAAEGAGAKVAVLGAELKGLGGAGALAGAEGAAGAGLGRAGLLRGALPFLGPVGITLAIAQAAQIFGHSRAGHAVDKVGNAFTDALGLTNTKHVASVAELRAAGFNKEADAVEAAQKKSAGTGLTGPAGVAGLPASLAGLAGPTTAMTSAAFKISPTTLSPAQKLALELAQNPNDITFLNEKAAADQHTIDWLNKRRAQGKIDAADYVKQISALYSDQQSVQGTISGIQTQAAATAKAAADAAKALAEAFTVPDALQIGQARAGTTAGLGDDVAMAREMKAFALHALASHKLGTQGTIEALNALAQANQVIGAFNVPLALQIAQAKDATTKSTKDDIATAREMKAFAEHALASKKLSAQGQIDAYNAIASANSVIGAADASVDAHGKRVSAETLTAGLGLTGPARKEAEARIAQALAHGGHVPTGIGLQGIGAGKGDVHIHGDIVLPGVRDAHTFAAELEQLGKHSAVQSRGINAGRFRGHP